MLKRQAHSKAVKSLLTQPLPHPPEFDFAASESRARMLEERALICEQRALRLEERAEILAREKYFFSLGASKREQRKLRAKARSWRFQADIYRSRAVHLSQAALTHFKREGGHVN